MTLDPTVLLVLIGTFLLGLASALVGSFAFLRKRSLVGDAIAHSVLPGICLAYILFDSKDPIILLLGAGISGWISILFVDWIVRGSKLSTDTAIGLVLSVFFGFGVLLLTGIQSSGSASQSGLDKFLFGKAASMSLNDVYLFAGLAVVLTLLILLSYKELKLISFDTDYAKSIGLPVRMLEIFISTLTVLATVVGIQVVGVVLMAALLIAPAAIANFWTDKLKVLLVIAAFSGGLAGVGGTLISYSAPAMPTGPWIVLLLGMMAFISVFFAWDKGVISKSLKQRSHQLRMLRENVLKLFFKLGERDGKFQIARDFQSLLTLREDIDQRSLTKALRHLVSKGDLTKKGDLFVLSDHGFERASQIVRLHRLWELYLNTKLHIAPDHVHNDAEALEHIISPELEGQIDAELGFPSLDPHDKIIPRLPEKGKLKGDEKIKN